ncbi:hypothetical protein KQ303_08550 [Synechococcus sp. CS-1333]|nr:hypothetical protein [Synechococcus sp. CS-1333]
MLVFGRCKGGAAAGARGTAGKGRLGTLLATAAEATVELADQGQILSDEALQLICVVHGATRAVVRHQRDGGAADHDGDQNGCQQKLHQAEAFVGAGRSMACRVNEPLAPHPQEPHPQEGCGHTGPKRMNLKDREEKRQKMGEVWK